MTDEQKADLAVLADEIEGWEDQARQCSTEETRKSCIASAESLQRIHDVLSARLADAVQPAAGEGGLREALAALEAMSEALEVATSTSGYSEHSSVERDSIGVAEDLALRTIASLRAALSTSVPAGVVGWQPIETAPKDGEKILVARGAQSICIAAHAQHKYRGHPWRTPHSMGGTTHFEPTHWMPLPAPPAQEPTR